MTGPGGADPTPTKSRKRSYVALVENAEDAQQEESLVVIGNCISANSIRRSGLLSGIEGTEGLASLPSKLSPEDVKLWETSYLIDIDLPVDELVTVLKVADALGDHNDSTWIQKLAEAVADTAWAQPEHGHSMLFALLRLPPHLVHRVLRKVLLTGHGNLSEFLREIPATIHPALLAAAASQGGLQLDHDVADAALPLLPCTSVPDPGLRGLHMRSGCYNVDSERKVSADVMGALLARAVAAHPSLTNLSLGCTALTPGWLHSFSACLPRGALPQLVSFTLSVDHSGCADLARSLALLPSLTTLSVTLISQETLAASAAMSLTSFTRLATAPASLSHLQRLTIREGAEKCEHCEFGRTQFLGLRHCVAASCAHSFLSVLTAPGLQWLRLELLTPRVPLSVLMSKLLRFKALQELHISAAIEVADMESAALGAATFELPALTSLTVDSVCVASAAAVAAAFAELAKSTLASLVIAFTEVEDGDTVRGRDRCNLAVRTAVMQDCFCVIGRCTALRSLQLRCLCVVCDDDRADYDRGLASCIAQLTALTHLLLRPMQGGAINLDGSSIGDAISKTTALQRLSLDAGDVIGRGNIAIVQLEPVVDACMQLKQLWHIDLSFDAPLVEGINDLLTKLPDLLILRLRKHNFSRSDRAALKDVKNGFPDVRMIVD